MASVFTENFETGPDGTTLSTSNTSFSAITGTPVFDDADIVAPVEGSFAGLFDAAATTKTAQADHTLGGTIVVRFYLYVVTLPSADMVLVHARSTTTARHQIRLRTDGSLQMRNNVTSVYISTNTLSLNTWYRIEWKVVNGTGQTLRIFTGANLHGTTALEDSGAQTANTGTMNNVLYGVITSTTAKFLIDAIAEDDTDWVGPLNVTVDKSDTETGSGSESTSIAATLTATDTASGANTHSIGVTGAETSSGVDANTLAVTLPASDTASSVDTHAIGLTQSQTASAVESASSTATLTGTDTGSGTEGTPTIGQSISDDGPNMLTLNQATLETSASGWQQNSNATVARSTAQALEGSASLSITSVSTGASSAFATPTNAIPAQAGNTYTALASFRAATTGRTVAVSIHWRDSANVSLGSSQGSNVTDSTSGWVQATVTATAPTNTAFVYMIVRVTDAGQAAGETHYADAIGIFPGTVSTWSYYRSSTESVSALAATLATGDTAAGTASSSTSATVPASDTASGTDSASITAPVAAADTASVVDAGTLTAAGTASDVAGSTDDGSVVAEVPATDTGTSTQAASIAVSDTDSATSTSATTIAATTTSADAGSAIEAASIGTTGADVGTASESAAIVSPVSASDAASIVDVSTLAASLSQSDTANTSEGSSSLAAIEAADTALSADLASLLVALLLSDSATAAEAVVLAAELVVNEAANAIDSAEADSGGVPIGVFGIASSTGSFGSRAQPDAEFSRTALVGGRFS